MKSKLDLQSGQTICPLGTFDIEGGTIRTSDGHRLEHRTNDYNAILVGRFLVSICAIRADDTITVNLNQLAYTLATPFVASTGEKVSGFKDLPEAEKQRMYVHADEAVRHSAIAAGFVPAAGESGLAVICRDKLNGDPDLVAVSATSRQPQDVVFSTTGLLLPFPVRSTMALPKDRHLRLTGGAEFLRHACQPNLCIRIVGETISGVALRPIEKGELLTFNYLTTEWEIAMPFSCNCSAFACYGFIQGFRYLDQEQQDHLLPLCIGSICDKYHHPVPESARLVHFEDSTLIAASMTGELVAQRSAPSGTVLMHCTRYQVDVRHLCLDHIRVRHSCEPTTVFLNNYLIALVPLEAGAPLTVNLCTVLYQHPVGFQCNCGSNRCVGTVSGFQNLPHADKDRLLPFTSPSVRTKALQEAPFPIRCTSTSVVVKPNGPMGQTTFAATAIPSGSHFLHVKGLVLPFPTVYTIYLGEGNHLLFGNGAHCLAHSCQPNVRIAVDPECGNLECVALCDIAEGDVLAFNYLTTEWDMNSPFTCLCGVTSPSGLQGQGCYHRIRGFRHLDASERQALWSYATPAIRTLAASYFAGSALARLDRKTVLVRPGGLLTLAKDHPAGTVLLAGDNIAGFTVQGSDVVLGGDLRVPHHCDANTAFIGGRWVLTRPQRLGDLLCMDLAPLQLCHPDGPHCPCNCGSWNCRGLLGGFQDLSVEEQQRLLPITHDSVRDLVPASVSSLCPLVEVRQTCGALGHATFAHVALKAGTRFFRTTGLTIPFPTVYTILLDDAKHLIMSGGAECLAHSCNPNVRVVADAANTAVECVALRDVSAGELLSFNYLCTEWSMDVPFSCVCGAAACYGEIRGFQHLSNFQRQQLWADATPAIRAAAAPDMQALVQGTVTTLPGGTLIAAADCRAGVPLFTVERHQVDTSKGGSLLLDGIRIPHAHQPNTALLNHTLVTLSPVLSGEPITIHLSTLKYQLALPPTALVTHDNPPRGFQALSNEEKNAIMLYTAPEVRAAATRDGYRIQSTCEEIVVRPHPRMGQATYAAKNISVGTHFLQVEGLVIPFPTVYTIYLGEQKHLLFANGAQCLAHLCDPNVRIFIDSNTGALECVALRDIEEGELIGFNYLTTEWDMDCPFSCACGASNCFHEIRGFRHLDTASANRLLPLVSPAIRQLAAAAVPHELPTCLEIKTDGFLAATRLIAPSTTLVFAANMEIQLTQITLRGGAWTVKHSNKANCVYVEGYLVAREAIHPEEKLTVNLNYFVYDMRKLFPDSYTAECQGFRYLSEEERQRFLYLCEPPVRAQAMRDGWIVKSSSPLLTVRPNGGMGQTAYATQSIPRGTTLFHATGLVVSFPTMYTICVGPELHLLFGDAAECIAHHCDPNVCVVVNADQTFDFLTIRPIAEGEMVTFNYLTTEWDMNSSFPCLCGADCCAGDIRGFKYLSDADRQRLWPITSDYVKSLCV